MATRLSKFIVALGLGFGCALSAMPSHDYGPITSSGTDCHGRDYVKAVGPLVEWAGPGDTPGIKAIRPFFTREDNTATGRDSLDILWPVGHWRHWQNETDWRFLTAWYFGPRATDPSDQYRFWILPVLALGRDKDGEDYGALFPIGGRIDNWFGRDRVEFAMFPLYWHSELNDLRTDHWLWPFVSRTTGDGLSRFRAFPFYGYSEKKGGGRNQFVLWPFWTSSRFDHPGARGSGFMLFPIYGHSKTECGETWLFLPPFFRHTTGKAGTENVYLWPLVQAASTKHEDKFYVWPLYGRRTTPGETRRFWLWPFVWNRSETQAKEDVNAVRVFPVFCSESRTEKRAVTNVVERYVSVWPLMSYERMRDTDKRVRVPDLWPFRDTPPIERNLTPLWTVSGYERSSRGSESELLWGLARWGCQSNGVAYRAVFPLASWGHDEKKDTLREWEFLKGMIGCRRDESGKTWRALYFIRWRTKP